MDNFDLNSSHVLPAMIRKFHEAKLNKNSTVELWGSGKPMREFLHVDDLADAIIQGIIMPTIEPVLNKVGGKDVTVKFGGIVIHLEKFISAFIKFLALAMIIYALMSAGVQITKPVSWVSVRSVADGVKL